MQYHESNGHPLTIVKRPAITYFVILHHMLEIGFCLSEIYLVTYLNGWLVPEADLCLKYLYVR